MKANALYQITKEFGNTDKYPVLFLGHGSPMNAIEENQFVQGFRDIAKTFDTPKAILVISAHWVTRGTKVTAMQQPLTIHDFGGFPKALFDVQYPAPGQPMLANTVHQLIDTTTVELDEKWGLDHGAWSVVKHMYPDANIPVVELSLDYYMTPQQHYELAKELAKLREKGVLIVGSGNIVHNLREIDWGHMNDTYGYDWANETTEKVRKFMLEGNHKALIDYTKLGRAFQLSIPTPDHYLPLLYALALQEKTDALQIFNDEPVGGSLTMTSVKVG